MKKEILDRENALVNMVQNFCLLHLDHEYSDLCTKLIKKLGRKRNVLFTSGKLEIWAAAIVHCIGTINFLFDKSFEPYISIDEINGFFGTKKSTTSNKSGQIRDLLKIGFFDDEFSTEYMRTKNPFYSYVMVNGLIVPLKTLPVEYQEQVKKARANGKDIEFFSD